MSKQNQSKFILLPPVRLLRHIDTAYLNFCCGNMLIGLGLECAGFGLGFCL